MKIRDRLPQKTSQSSLSLVKLNVTDLKRVGNAHPTVYQGFWRSHNAYFSAIPLKLK
ncbi:hypothetical protein MC7420_612 [Coleofasciculus chthonoplastes PCC 7420]|uniref:Uncharacterized protein n=1 Tax=Coleofasciculus chthonoplastes PCC 7420 TaxID=118168 RepID=B4VLC9_9CYAN|nr:hypothetical protein MC7420_612 [Coleofasciculus chthonoplastes PCC 7420]